MHDEEAVRCFTHFLCSLLAFQMSSNLKIAKGIKLIFTEQGVDFIIEEISFQVNNRLFIAEELINQLIKGTVFYLNQINIQIIMSSAQQQQQQQQSTSHNANQFGQITREDRRRGSANQATFLNMLGADCSAGGRNNPLANGHNTAIGFGTGGPQVHHRFAHGSSPMTPKEELLISNQQEPLNNQEQIQQQNKLRNQNQQQMQQQQPQLRERSAAPSGGVQRRAGPGGHSTLQVGAGLNGHPNNLIMTGGMSAGGASIGQLRVKNDNLLGVGGSNDLNPPTGINSGQNQNNHSGQPAMGGHRQRDSIAASAAAEESKFEGFFDNIVQHSLEPSKVSSDLLKIWEDLKDTAEAYSFMKVRMFSKESATVATPTPVNNGNPAGFSGKQQIVAGQGIMSDQKAAAGKLHLAVNPLNNQPNQSVCGDFRKIYSETGCDRSILNEASFDDYFCVLCQEHLFLFRHNLSQFQSRFSKNTNDGTGGIATGGVAAYGNNSQQMPQMSPQKYMHEHSANSNTQGACGPPNLGQDQTEIFAQIFTKQPDFYICVEFCKLRIIKNKEGMKCGFALTLREITIEFIIIIMNTKCINNETTTLYVNSANLCQPYTPLFSNQQNQSAGQNQMANNQTGVTGSQSPIQDIQERQFELRYIFKAWMRYLNEFVVRIESLKKYSISSQIGVGGQAKVYKIMKKINQPPHFGLAPGGQGMPVNSNNGQQTQSQQQQNSQYRTFAIKIITKKKFQDRSQREKIQMMHEIQVQRKLRYCGNSLRLFKIYESEKYLNLLMEFQEGGTLGDKLEKGYQFTEEEARIIMAQLLLTVDFMCKKGIIHRDLKPENVLLNSKQQGVFDIRIGDFGFAIAYDPQAEQQPDTKVVCGTAGYIPPEALDGKGYSNKSDLFSIGSILFSVLTLRNLFNGREYKDIMRANRDCIVETYLNQYLRKYSKQLRDFIGRLLNRDPVRRPSAIEALQHPWFQQEQLAVQSSLDFNNVMADTHLNSSLPRFHRMKELFMSSNSFGALGQLGSFASKSPANGTRFGGPLVINNHRSQLSIKGSSMLDKRRFSHIQALPSAGGLGALMGAGALNSRLQSGNTNLINLARKGYGGVPLTSLQKQSDGLALQNNSGVKVEVVEPENDEENPHEQIEVNQDAFVQDLVSSFNYYKILSEMKNSAISPQFPRNNLGSSFHNQAVNQHGSGDSRLLNLPNKKANPSTFFHGGSQIKGQNGNQSLQEGLQLHNNQRSIQPNQESRSAILNQPSCDNNNPQAENLATNNEGGFQHSNRENAKNTHLEQTTPKNKALHLHGLGAAPLGCKTPVHHQQRGASPRSGRRGSSRNIDFSTSKNINNIEGSVPQSGARKRKMSKLIVSPIDAAAAALSKGLPVSSQNLLSQALITSNNPIEESKQGGILPSQVSNADIKRQNNNYRDQSNGQPPLPSQTNSFNIVNQKPAISSRQEPLNSINSNRNGGGLININKKNDANSDGKPQYQVSSQPNEGKPINTEQSNKNEAKAPVLQARRSNNNNDGLITGVIGSGGRGLHTLQQQFVEGSGSEIRQGQVGSGIRVADQLKSLTNKNNQINQQSLHGVSGRRPQSSIAQADMAYSQKPQDQFMRNSSLSSGDEPLPTEEWDTLQKSFYWVHKKSFIHSNSKNLGIGNGIGATAHECPLQLSLKNSTHQMQLKNIQQTRRIFLDK